MPRFRVIYTIRDFKDVDADDSSIAAESVRTEVIDEYGPLRDGAVTVSSVSEIPEDDL